MFEGSYPICILNEEQGRGIDFSTNNLIEEQGGNYVIVGVVPKTPRDLQQFIGRSGRMGNKAQHSIILWIDDTDMQDGNI